MENRQSKEEPQEEENESHRSLNSLMSPTSISTRSIYANGHTSMNLNNLLLETIQTLNNMQNIISNFDIQQNMLLCQMDKQSDQEIKTENLLQKNKSIIDKFYNGNNIVNDLLSPTTESKQVNTITMVQPKNKETKTITNEIQMLVGLVKSIFQKLDDPNYVCENTDCQLLRENAINSKININSNNANQIINKDSVNQIKNKAPGSSRPLIKVFKKQDQQMENQQTDKKTLKLFNNKLQCTCSLVKEYYKQNNFLYINYGGRILDIDVSNES